MRTSGVLLLIFLVASPARAALSEAARLAAAYDAILDARFELAETRLQQACPPAPAEACAALRVVSLWWQILLDPENRQRDDRFNTISAAAIAGTDAWTKREPTRAEAWFYMAGAYAPLVQWRVLRGDRLAAAREGNRIRESLERALQLDPTLDDAHFGIGLYHYYADVAPAPAKLLRWLLFLPGGDRVKGLQEMLQTRERGALLRGEADYQLHVIYLWYERKPARALELLTQLDERYPFNPLFLQRIADARERWLHDRTASAAAWETLIDRARRGRVHDAPRVLAAASVDYARLLERTGDRARAIETYRDAARVVGGDQRARDQARAALARLGAS
jgi:tetratricopeptide (TPR) repeat protein